MNYKFYSFQRDCNTFALSSGPNQSLFPTLLAFVLVHKSWTPITISMGRQNSGNTEAVYRYIIFTSQPSELDKYAIQVGKLTTERVYKSIRTVSPSAYYWCEKPYQYHSLAAVKIYESQ